jgi:pimeloyl-ACP methyl ester carboxylesterase
VDIFYLHGFASSPESSKATFFAERFASRGVRLHCLDLNQPEFSTLTVSRMLRQLDERIAMLPEGPMVIIGSSLGGFVAIEAAARRAGDVRSPVAMLVLLAPAVELEWDRWSELGPGGVDEWRRLGAISIFHYAYGENRNLDFAFYEDANRYHVSTHRLPQPTLIFQGWHDESVSPELVQRFAAAQPRATLYMLEDGHQLKESLDFIWEKTAGALGPAFAP